MSGPANLEDLIKFLINGATREMGNDKKGKHNNRIHDNKKGEIRRNVPLQSRKLYVFETDQNDKDKHRVVVAKNRRH